MYQPLVQFSVYSRKTGMLSWSKHRGCKNRKEGISKRRCGGFCCPLGSFSALSIVLFQERRMKQQRDALLKEKETAEKIAARAFAQSYLADLVPSVFTKLNQSGFFYDPVERGVWVWVDCRRVVVYMVYCSCASAEVESIFMPWLMREAELALDEKILARVVMDG
jgi:hypothetical protein